MKLTTTTLLQKITAGCLLISIASWWGIKELGVENRGRQIRLNAALTDLKRAESDESYVRQALGTHTSAFTEIPFIEDAYATAMVTIRQVAPARSVSVTNISVGGKLLDTKGASLRSISEPFAVGNKLRKVRLKIQGRYESLTDLLKLMDGIRETASIIKAWNVKGNSFELEVLVLGK